MAYTSIASHRSMVLDAYRNEAYNNALAEAVFPDAVVLDLGAGLGIHGLLAAQLGARRVYMVEPEDIISVARQLAQANGLSDRMVFMQGKIEELGLPDPVDIIVSVLTGNFLLSEDLLPSLFHARDRYLKPDGLLIPHQAQMKIVPVQTPQLHHDEIGIWSQLHQNIDLSPVRSYADNNIVFHKLALETTDYLAEPQTVMQLDFHAADSPACDAEIECTITQDGLCHGWVGWFDMWLGEQQLSTAPHAPPLHWSQAFLPLDPPVQVSAGDVLNLHLVRPPFGDWAWSVKGVTSQKHSTFLAMPLTMKTIKQAALDYQPQLNQKGELVAFVLACAGQQLSIKQIAEQVAERFSMTDDEALRKVQNLKNLFD